MMIFSYFCCERTRGWSSASTDIHREWRCVDADDARWSGRGPWTEAACARRQQPVSVVVENGTISTR